MLNLRWRCPMYLIALLVAIGARAWAAEAPLPQQFDIPRMSTSIYIGSVSLTTSTFTLTPGAYNGTYEAKVSPWSWWNEAGSIRLSFVPGDYERLLRGETIELTGEAKNDDGKIRTITSQVRPSDATTGTIKVRIHASGTTLVFNGTYRTSMPAVASTP